jgi:hypothetical protein
MVAGLARRGQARFTVESKTTRHRFTGAIALMALILTITVMAAPKWVPQKAVSDTYGPDYLILNFQTD